MSEIKNNGIPTPKTKGSMGDIYTDTSTGEQYICVFAYSSHAYSNDENYYAWVKIKNQSSVSAKEPYVEEMYNSSGNLKDVKLHGYNKIRGYAFSGCSNLALTELPSKLTEIGEYAFYGCSNLALTELPSGIVSIGGYAFSDCSSLALTELPSKLTEIGEYAFGNCSGLISLRFLGTPKTISNTAFSTCNNLVSIKVPWSEGAVANAPWGATNATVTYDYTG